MKKPYINPAVPEETRKLLLHIKDIVFRVEKTGHIEFTHFLSESERIICDKFMQEFSGSVNYIFDGGFDNAERTILGIYDLYSEIPDRYEFPYKCITFNYRGNSGLSHRDFLGCLMSCGIKRDVIGDICVTDTRTQIFILENFVETVSSITKIGNTGVEFSDNEEFVPVLQKFRDINATVSSLRADAVLKAILGVSRDTASELIKQGKVVRNGIPESSVSKTCAAGDLISVRGYGKFRLADAGEITKKGRIRIKAKKYL